MIRMRAFRAVDDTDSCFKFADGHQNVLKSYGVQQVTSADLSWLYNPNVYVIMVENNMDRKVLGGTRIHVANKYPLPMEDALGHMDQRMYKVVADRRERGVGELCGLWTAKESSGQGLSILLTDAGVAEAGIALAQQLRLSSLYVLCAPWTVKMAMNAGFSIVEDVGNKGQFMYPLPDLLATLLVIEDIDTLERADPDKRERIYDLRRNPKQKKTEYGPKGILEVEYDLFISESK